MDKTRSVENDIIKIDIKLTQDEYSVYEDKAYNREKGKYAVDGFRKGKAPKKMIEMYYGKGVFLETAVNIVLNDCRNELLTEEEMTKIIDEKVDLKSFDENGIELELLVYMYPEVKLGAYKGLEIKKDEVTVSEEEIERDLRRYQEQGVRLVDVTDRAVENGDVTIIDFEGKLDGVAFPGGTAKMYQLEIGSGSFIPGFEEQIIGMNIDETRDINVTFPENYQAEELAGKETVFTIVLHEIKKKEYPEINDELASNCSQFETLDELKENIRKELTTVKERQAEFALEEKILTTIADSSDVNVPEIFTEQEVDDGIRRLTDNLYYQGVTLDQYLKYINKTEKELRQDMKSDAEKRVKSQLVINKILETENITCTDEDLNNAVANEAEKANKTAEEYIKGLREEDVTRRKNSIIIEKLFKMLKEDNKIV